MDLLGEEELERHIIRTLNITHSTVEYNQLLHASVEDHSMKTIDSVELGFGLNNVKFFSVFNTATPICRILVTQPVIEHHCNIGTSMTTLSQAVKPIQLHTIIAQLSDSTLFCATAMAMPVFLHLCNSIYACF